jgi:hypothetical protein
MTPLILFQCRSSNADNKIAVANALDLLLGTFELWK